MEAVELNLAGLSEEELFHIKDVLRRDKKLQETRPLVRLAINNNNPGGKTKPSAREMVTAEIERVHHLMAKSSRSRENTPSPSGSESTDEGFFSSFAGLISRGMEVIGSNRKRLTSGTAQETKEMPRTQFNYNPRESVKKKPTLLQLAVSRKLSAPAYHSVSADEEESVTYRRNRSNAIFTTLHNTHTIPRNFKSGSATANSPIFTRSRPRSPSESDKGNAPKFQTAALTSNISPPRPKVLISAASEDGASSATSGGYKISSVSLQENFSIGENPDKGSHKISRGSKCESPLHPSSDTNSKTEMMIEGNDKPGPASSRSCDSGISSYKPEFFIRKGDNESLIEDETDRLAVYDYEPDTESVYDADTLPFGEYADDGTSLTSASSIHGSPMGRFHGHFARDSWGDSDCSSGVSANQKHDVSHSSKSGHLARNISPAPHEPHWVRQKRRRREKSSGKVQAGAVNAIGLSPATSPCLSHRSTPNSRASSPLERQEVIPSPVNNMDTIGNLELSLIYYSAESFMRKSGTSTGIPPYGTKSAIEKNCHVLSRREYVEVTGADLHLSKHSSSGAPESSNGELHVTIKGAKFQDPSGKIKAPNTYVKCYLLPDKFHNSKMKSAIIKKSKEPKWDHKFILAGFSQSELRERSLEVIVGSWHFKKHEVLGGAILSVGQGGRSQPWISSTKDEAYIWKTVLQISGNKVKTLLPLRANMKPTYA